MDDKYTLNYIIAYEYKDRPYIAWRCSLTGEGKGWENNGEVKSYTPFWRAQECSNFYSCFPPLPFPFEF
jgi:hypothetical protein